MPYSGRSARRRMQIRTYVQAACILVTNIAAWCRRWSLTILLCCLVFIPIIVADNARRAEKAREVQRLQTQLNDIRTLRKNLEIYQYEQSRDLKKLQQILREEKAKWGSLPPWPR